MSCDKGETAAVLKGALRHDIKDRYGLPAIGDYVLMEYHEDQSVITRVLERASAFVRADFSGHAAGYVKTVLEQVVAANFDYVFIVSSLNRDFSINRIARYITLARQSGGEAVVILTKTDLCGDWREQVSQIRALAADIAVIPISNRTGYGMDDLAPYLAPGKTIVLLGMSGVGKSSLINALTGEARMSVKEVRSDARGRHATTHRQVVELPSGAFIIDTPGMREVGLLNAGEGIALTFEEVEALFARCRFNSCGHTVEPGCAVLEAIEEGRLSRAQWERYNAQIREAAFMKRRGKARAGGGKRKRDYADHTIE